MQKILNGLTPSKTEYKSIDDKNIISAFLLSIWRLYELSAVQKYDSMYYIIRYCLY